MLGRYAATWDDIRSAQWDGADFVLRVGRFGVVRLPWSSEQPELVLAVIRRLRGRPNPIAIPLPAANEDDE